jgi:hypothetical protein
MPSLGDPPLIGQHHEESSNDIEVRRASQNLVSQVETQADLDTVRSFTTFIPGWKYRHYGWLILTFVIVHAIQAFIGSSSSTGGGNIGTTVVVPAQTSGLR